jgi:hypothetical protein
MGRQYVAGIINNASQNLGPTNINAYAQILHPLILP